MTDVVLVERMLDEVESDHPTLRVVRLRPGLIFQRAAGTEIGLKVTPAGYLLKARWGSEPLLLLSCPFAREEHGKAFDC